MIVVFGKGGKLAKNDKWSIGGDRIQAVPCFTYVGVNFTRQLSLIQWRKNKRLKANVCLFQLYVNFTNTVSFQKKCFFKIFDTKICPVLLYRSELSGIQKQVAIERVQNYAC